MVELRKELAAERKKTGDHASENTRLEQLAKERQASRDVSRDGKNREHDAAMVELRKDLAAELKKTGTGHPKSLESSDMPSSSESSDIPVTRRHAVDSMPGVTDDGMPGSAVNAPGAVNAFGTNTNPASALGAGPKPAVNAPGTNTNPASAHLSPRRRRIAENNVQPFAEQWPMSAFLAAKAKRDAMERGQRIPHM